MGSAFLEGESPEWKHGGEAGLCGFCGRSYVQTRRRAGDEVHPVDTCRLVRFGLKQEIEKTLVIQTNYVKWFNHFNLLRNPNARLLRVCIRIT